jgi:hypothetical protein
MGAMIKRLKIMENSMPAQDTSTTLQKYLSRAEKYAEEDPEGALNNLRKFWEVIVESLADEFEIERHPMKSTNDMFTSVRSRIPIRLGHYLEHIQRMGNFGSHWQGGIEPPTEDSLYCLWAATEVFQWRNPGPTEMPISSELEFIRVICDAVPCEYCNQGIGSECISGKGEPTGTDRDHTLRKKEYAKYRRAFQKHYATTLVDCMHEMVADMNIQLGQFLTGNEIREWYEDKYPAYTETAINCHAYMMTTNLKTRLSHNLHDDREYDLFFSEDRKFRLYQPGIDPEPITHGTQ